MPLFVMIGEMLYEKLSRRTTAFVRSTCTVCPVRTASSPENPRAQ